MRNGILIATSVGVTLLLVMPVVISFWPRNGSQKSVIGAVEDVTLLTWGVTMPARVDTGAATSSVAVVDLVARGNRVTFRFPPKYGGKEQIKLPITGWRWIKSSDGREEHRPVVEMEIRIGTTQPFRTQVTLDDRTKMTFPMLIGRRSLEGRFAVDVDRQKAASDAEGEPGE